jgi:hypothetical protein
MIEIDVPDDFRIEDISPTLTETIAERVLREVNPDQDFSVTITLQEPGKLIVKWMAVD